MRYCHMTAISIASDALSGHVVWMLLRAPNSALKVQVGMFSDLRPFSWHTKAWGIKDLAKCMYCIVVDIANMRWVCQDMREQMEALQPTVAKLAKLETLAQQSFLKFKFRWTAAGV